MTTASQLASRVGRLEATWSGDTGWSEPIWYRLDATESNIEPFTPSQQLRDYVREEARRLRPEVSGWHVAFWAPNDSCGPIVILASGEDAQVIDVPPELSEGYGREQEGDGAH